jgi:hypothetical protein
MYRPRVAVLRLRYTNDSNAVPTLYVFSCTPTNLAMDEVDTEV